MRVRGITLIELVLGFALSAMVVAGAFAVFRWGRISTEKSLGPQMNLQMASRRALLDFIKEVQEAIEIVRPAQGASLNYFMARDKLNQILVGYLVENPAASAQAGKTLYDLILYRHDYSETPRADSRRRLLEGVERLSFTTVSPGVLQIHVDFHDQGKTYSFLSSVRARNIYADSDL